MSRIIAANRAQQCQKYLRACAQRPASRRVTGARSMPDSSSAASAAHVHRHVFAPPPRLHTPTPHARPPHASNPLKPSRRLHASSSSCAASHHRHRSRNESRRTRRSFDGILRTCKVPSTVSRHRRRPPERRGGGVDCVCPNLLHAVSRMFICTSETEKL